MPKKKTHEEFTTEVRNLVGDEYTFLEEYKGSHEKIKCRHNICGHEYSVTPKMFLKGTRCPNCARNQKKTNEKFLEEIYTLVKDEYSFLEPYINTYTAILCRHNTCGYTWKVRPQDFLNRKNKTGTRCPKCAGVPRYTLKDAKQIFADKGLILLADTYENSLTLMPFICSKHKDKGVQYKSLSDLTRVRSTYGCYYCGMEAIGKSNLIRTEYKEVYECFKSHGLKLLETDYRGVEAFYLCQCLNHPEHGKFKIQYKSIKYSPTRTVQCPYCSESAKSKGELMIREYFIKNKIKFIEYNTFEGLNGTGNRKLSFDFYLPDHNLLIEFQGAQHERSVDIFGGEHQFKVQKEHDRRKRNYAKEHGYELLEIWYYDIENIDQILDNHLLTSQEVS